MSQRPRYVNPQHSKSYEQVRADAIQDDADKAIDKLHSYVRNGYPGKCNDVVLSFPVETSKELRSRGFNVTTSHYHLTTLCFKE